MNRRIRWLIVGAVVVGGVPSMAATACVDHPGTLNERCPAWASSYSHADGRGGRGEDIARDLAVSPDGASVYVTGQSRNDATGDDQAVAAFDAATGAVRWTARATTPGVSFDTGSAIAVSPDGSRVFAAGRSDGAGFDWLTAAYAASNGAKLWEARYATPQSDRTWALAPSPDGEVVYVVGESAGTDTAIVAYDAATGEERWRGSHGSAGHDIAFDIRVAPDGRTVYAAGIGWASATLMDVVVIAFRTEDEDEQPAGSTRWVAHVDGGKAVDDTFAGFDMAADGSTLAVGGFYTDGALGPQATTALLDAADGRALWRVNDAASPGDTDVRDSLRMSEDRVVRVGRVAGETVDSTQFRTLAYRIEDGSLAWSAVQGSLPLYKDIGKSVGFSADGSSVYVSGYSLFPYGETNGFRFEPGHVTTVAYDAATGSRRWVALHDQSGIGRDFAVSVVPSPTQSRVFVGATFKLMHTDLTPPGAGDLTMRYAYDFGAIAYDD